MMVFASLPFENMAELIHMGGHGIYVWSAFVISIGLLTMLLWKPLWAQRQLLKEVQQHMAREKNYPVADRD